MAEADTDSSRREEAAGAGGTAASVGWQTSVGRVLGTAARLAAAQGKSILATLAGVGTPQPRARRPTRDTLPTLLAQLEELLQSSTDTEFAHVAENPVFWSLVRRIHVQRPQRRRRRSRRRPVPDLRVSGPAPADAANATVSPNPASAPASDEQPAPADAADATASPDPASAPASDEQAAPAAAPDAAAEAPEVGEGTAGRQPAKRDAESTSKSRTETGDDKARTK